MLQSISACLHRRRKISKPPAPRPAILPPEQVTRAVVADLNAAARKAGQHRGPISPAFERVLVTLLYGFLDPASSRCDPCYETIGREAGCSRATVARALKTLEDLHLLGWAHQVSPVYGADQIADGKGRILTWRRCSNFYEPGARLRAAAVDHRGVVSPENETGIAYKKVSTNIRNKVLNSCRERNINQNNWALSGGRRPTKMRPRKHITPALEKISKFENEFLPRPKPDFGLHFPGQAKFYSADQAGYSRWCDASLLVTSVGFQGGAGMIKPQDVHDPDQQSPIPRRVIAAFEDGSARNKQKFRSYRGRN